MADKTTYTVGETITLSVVGDSEGAAAFGVLGILLFDDHVSWISTVQVPLTSLDEGLTWVQGYSVASCAMGGHPPGCPAFDQIAGLSPVPVDDLLLSTMVLAAVAPGAVAFSWFVDQGATDRLAFFGLTNAPGTSIIIIPEPDTFLLVALGLILLTTLGRAPKPARVRR